MDKTYSPNFSPNRKPTTVPMLEKALKFAIGFTDPKNPRPLADALLEQVMCRRDKPAGKWLRQMLLTPFYSSYCFDTEESAESKKKDTRKGRCRQYVRNVAGCEYIKNLLIEHSPEFAAEFGSIPDYEQKMFVSFIDNQFGAELTSGDINYKNADCGRKLHPIQNVASEKREMVLALYGYEHDYDVQACYPTIITQYARSKGFKGTLQYLDLYLSDTTGFRNLVAEQCGMTYSEIKLVITAFFNGAPLKATNSSSIVSSLSKNKRKVAKETNDSEEALWLSAFLESRKNVNALKQNDFIVGLKKDIAKIWRFLKPEFNNEKGASGRTKKLSGSQKANRYFKLERLVLDAITEELDVYGIKHLDIHDGCMTDREIDVVAVQNAIKAKTGFDVKITKKQ